MATRLESPSDTERRLAQELRARALHLVDAEGLGTAAVAERLGLLPTGAERLMAREWSLDVAMRVAEALGLQVEFEVRSTT